MAAHVTLTLDTTPPQLRLSTPYRLVDGRLAIPYEIDEPELLAVQVNRAVCTFDGGEIRTSVVLPQGGDLDIRARVRDDVGNATTRRYSSGLKPTEGRVAKSSGYAPPTEQGTHRRPEAGHIARPERGEKL